MPSQKVKPQQLGPTFPDYPWWVIHRLVGIYARDPNNVVVAIVTRWIEQNEEFLGKKGASFEEWQESLTLGPQGLVSPLKASKDKNTPKEENGEDGNENGGNGKRSNGG